MLAERAGQYFRSTLERSDRAEKVFVPAARPRKTVSGRKAKPLRLRCAQAPPLQQRGGGGGDPLTVLRPVPTYAIVSVQLTVLTSRIETSAVIRSQGS